ncbi:MAG TPA: hypothetical protein VIV60_14150, partial [Polyangiaceae bacterium]
AIPGASDSSWLDTVAFSASSMSLEPRTARRLARILSLVDGRKGELIVGHSGVYHLVLSSNGGEHAV